MYDSEALVEDWVSKITFLLYITKTFSSDKNVKYPLPFMEIIWDKIKQKLFP